MPAIPKREPFLIMPLAIKKVKLNGRTLKIEMHFEYIFKVHFYFKSFKQKVGAVSSNTSLETFLIAKGIIKKGSPLWAGGKQIPPLHIYLFEKLIIRKLF